MKTRLETLIDEAQIQATNHPSKDARFFAASVHRYLTGQTEHNPVPVEHCLWARNGNAPCPHTSHDAHQPPDPFAPDVVAVIPEIFAEIPLSVERTLYVKPIHDLHDFTVFLGGFGLAVGEPVSVDS